jgi:SlyX protein
MPEFEIGTLCDIKICASVLKFCRRRNVRKFTASTWPGSGGKMTRMADEIQQRVEKLESHVAHLEHQVEQLNGVIIEQGRLLERLKKETQRQSTALKTLELERIKATNAKPPHYQ